MQSITKQNSDFLKFLGAFSMLIDHIGAFLYPQYIILRIIGRIAFPLFAYQASIGYRMTSNLSRYIKRLIVFGIISQYPYYLLNRDYRLNIFFSFLLAIWGIWALEKAKYWYFFIIIPASFFVSYGLYGVLMILGFYLLNKKWKQVSFLVVITTLYVFYYRAAVQWFAILALLFIYKFNYFKIRLPKYFFYIFYPAHLSLLYLIRKLLL